MPVNDMPSSDAGELFSIERVAEGTALPSDLDFVRWLTTALTDCEREPPMDPSIPWVSVRVVDDAEAASLNLEWRGRAYATNVLSFPSEVPGFLGDIVLCAPVIQREAGEQGKAVSDHWAHLVVHGALHLCGWDHQTDRQAEAMEAHEALILDRLGIINPYIEQ